MGLSLNREQPVQLAEARARLRPDEPLLSVRKFAVRAGVSVAQVRRWVGEGLPSEQRAGSTWLRESSLAWVEQRKRQAA